MAANYASDRTVKTDNKSPSSGYKAITDALQRGADLNEIGFSQVGKTQRESALKMANAWFALKRVPGNAAESHLREVLAGLGFAGQHLVCWYQHWQR